MGDLYNPFPKLPKNVRQIGDPDQVVRLYMEDYVNTYLKQLYPSGKQTMRVGVLLGSTEQYDGTPYIFIDGAMELEDVETDGEKIVFSESSWKKLYPAMESTFPTVSYTHLWRAGTAESGRKTAGRTGKAAGSFSEKQTKAGDGHHQPDGKNTQNRDYREL